MSYQLISHTLSKAMLRDEILIRLKIWNTYITGKLVRFDNKYMNLILKDAKEIYFGRGGKRSKNLGTILIRGASIIFVGQDHEKLIFSDSDLQSDEEMQTGELEEDH